MRILINTSHQRFGGAIQVANSFINECKNFPEHEYFVWLGPGITPLIDKHSFPENFAFKSFDFGVLSLSKAFKINKTLRAEEEKIKPDCVISTSGPTYFNSKAPQIIGFNLPLYIYPESPYLKNQSWKSIIRLRIKRMLHLYFFSRDATAYVTQTDDVRDRVKATLKTDKVYTVSNTYSNSYVNWKKSTPKLRSRKDGEIRLLTISSYYPHKDLEIISDIVEELEMAGRNDLIFILTLDDKDFHQHFVTSNDRIINVGPIRPDECPSLYDEADIMFLPTLAECFSASYPEAMIMQKPIVTTELGFAKSICADAAEYFIPTNAKSALQAIIKVVDNPVRAEQLKLNGLKQVKTFDTAKERASKYLMLCENIK